MRGIWIAFAGLVVALMCAPCVAQQPAGALVGTVSQYTLSPEQMHKAEALYRIRTVLYLTGTVYGMLVLAVLLRAKVADAYQRWAESTSRLRVVQAFVFTPLLLLTLALLELPLSIYGHHVSLSYGLSVQRWGSWFWDWAKGELIFTIVAALLAWGLYALIRRSPRRWWFYAWLCTAPLIVFAVFISPVLLDPIFNRFEPLARTQPQLVSELQRVAKRGGLEVPESRMFEMKASEKVTTYNAYVTGIGTTKRIVVWDNTARDMTVPQTLFVFGHEMGHYVLNHIYKGMALGFVLSFAGFALMYVAVTRIVARRGGSLGIHSVSDWASLPLIMLVFSALSFVGEPIANTYSRHLEHDADIYGLEVTRGINADSAQVAAQSFQLLGEKSFDYPTPNRIFVLWAYSHPTISERVRFALDYRPWELGKPTKFVK